MWSKTTCEGDGGGAPPPSSTSVSDLAQLVEPDEAVDLRDLALELVAVAVHHAAGDEELRAGAALLARRHLEDGVDRLALRLVDEGAGVDDHGLGRVGVGHDLVAATRELAEQDLAVDEVLGAAEADQADGGGTGRGTHERTILPEPDGRAQEAAAGDATRRSSQRTSCDGGASWVMPNSVGRRGGCSSARARATQ